MITHTQRVKAALEGKMLDRPAFAAWGPHMNLVDRNAKDFARATIDYQNAHHFDFIRSCRTACTSLKPSVRN